MNVIRF
jgi:hypothetical protein